MADPAGHPGGIARLLTLVRDHPDALEADLLTVFGAALPEDWLETGWVSMRRLLLIVRHLPPSSAVARVLELDWDRSDSQLDDIRRGVWALATRTDVPMHPDRPLAKRSAAEKAERAARRQSKHEAQQAREAERQARIRAAQTVGGEP